MLRGFEEGVTPGRSRRGRDLHVPQPGPSLSLWGGGELSPRSQDGEPGCIRRRGVGVEPAVGQPSTLPWPLGSCRGVEWEVAKRSLSDRSCQLAVDDFLGRGAQPP